MAFGYYKDGAWVSLASQEGGWGANRIGVDKLVPGLFYSPNARTDQSAGGAANFKRATPFYNAVTTSYDRIGIQVTTAVAAGLVRLGIYKIENGVPTSLVVDGGDVDASTTGQKEVTIAVTLEPGWYGLTVNRNNITIALRAASVVGRLQIGGTNLTSISMNTMWQVSETYAAFPSTFGTATPVAFDYHVALRAA
jgi:hypothetical protein